MMIAACRIVQRLLPVCWLVIVVCTCCARGNPIITPALATKSHQVISASSNNEAGSSVSEAGEEHTRRLCGDELATALQEACVLFPSLFDQLQGSDGKGHSAVDECCKKPCSEKTLHGFCSKVRSPPLSKSSPATNNNVHQQEAMNMTGEPTTMEPIITTPTDPTSRPEFAYAGDFWDQEPLTLLPTYTSPDYTMNVMQRL